MIRPTLHMRTMLIRLLNRLVPHHCPICDVPIERTGLCAGCWSHLCFILPPLCQQCGMPLPQHKSHHDALSCARCLNSESPLRISRSLLRYDEASRALILPFKHASRLDLTALISGMMQRQFNALCDDHSLIMPIPLHVTRRLYRRYNQSAELARHLCYGAGRRRQLDVTSLYRRKATRPLARHNKAKRRAILADAFAIRTSRIPLIKGRSILLIDDVMTTGQTCDSAARCLLDHGAAHVDCLTFARVT